MKKKDKTPAGNQNKNLQSQSKVYKSGISFDPETWKHLENYAGSEFKGNKSKACITLSSVQPELLYSAIVLYQCFLVGWLGFEPQTQMHTCIIPSIIDAIQNYMHIE